MPVLINHAEVVHDRWQRLDDEQPLEGHTRVIVSVERLLREHGRLRRSGAEIGVELDAQHEIEQITDFLGRLRLVVLHFDAFADGRAFSQARLLRERYAFDGHIRASGEVLRDQLAFMQRCGFDQFELADGEDVGAALGAFGEISRGYQPELRAVNAR